MKIDSKLRNNQTMSLTHRIYHILRILKDSEYLNLNNSKKYYLKLFKKEIYRVFHYPTDSINYFLTLFPVSEVLKFIEWNEKQRPLTIRYNELKKGLKEIRLCLENRGLKVFDLEKPLDIAGIIFKNSLGHHH